MQGSRGVRATAFRYQRFGQRPSVQWPPRGECASPRARHQLSKPFIGVSSLLTAARVLQRPTEYSDEPVGKDRRFTVSHHTDVDEKTKQARACGPGLQLFGGAAGNRTRSGNASEQAQHRTSRRESTSDNAKVPAGTRQVLTASTPPMLRFRRIPTTAWPLTRVHNDGVAAPGQAPRDCTLPLDRGHDRRKGDTRCHRRMLAPNRSRSSRPHARRSA